MLRPDTIALTAVLALLVAFGPVATDMYVPSMPEIGRLLDAGTAEVQLTLSSYLIGFAIGQSFYGPISDRYGRKPVLLIALLIFCSKRSPGPFANELNSGALISTGYSNRRQ